MNNANDDKTTYGPLPEYLEQRLLSLESNLDVVHQRIDMLREDLSKYINAIMDEQIQTYGRIKNLEKAVFPNLIKDLDRLNDIIGPDSGGPDHPKDRREP